MHIDPSAGSDSRATFSPYHPIRSLVLAEQTVQGAVGLALFFIGFPALMALLMLLEGPVLGR